MFEDIRKELPNSAEDFNNTYEASVRNSVGAAPVRNNRKITLTQKGKKVVAVCTAIIISVSSFAAGIGAKKASDNYKDLIENRKAYHIIAKDYSGLAIAKHIPGTNKIYYDHSEIARQIKNNEKIFLGGYNSDMFQNETYNVEEFDKIVYAAWRFMAGDDAKQPQLATANMEEVFSFLGYPSSFEGYIEGKGFINGKGGADLAAYSDYMNEQIIREADAVKRGSK